MATIRELSGKLGDLKGGSAFILFAVILLYFVIFTRYLGGTLSQRLLRVR